jgi:hypothetical protein
MTNKFQIQIPKSQTNTVFALFWLFEFYSLGFIWDLFFDAWSF